MITKEIKNDLKFIKNHTLQPAWWKVTKTFILLGILITIFFLFGIVKLVIWFSIFITLLLILHFTYKINTHTYTKSWMDFKVKKVKGKLIYGRIGIFYYSVVILTFLIATTIIILLK